MDEVALAKRVGRLLRIEREKRFLTQRGLARRVGTSQQCVSRVEAGRFAASTDLLERLFDAIDVQLEVGAQARDADLDRSIAEAVGGRSRGLLLDSARCYLRIFLKKLGDVPYLVDGALAAMVQGVPMATERIDLAFAARDVDAVTAGVREQGNWKRWEERWQDFGSADANLTRGVLPAAGGRRRRDRAGAGAGRRRGGRPADRPAGRPRALLGQRVVRDSGRVQDRTYGLRIRAAAVTTECR